MHQKTKICQKIEIIEYSILFIILNFSEIASKRVEKLFELKFLSEKNESLKNLLLNMILEGNDKDNINSKINTAENPVAKEINENANIQIITKNKKEKDILYLLDELIQDHQDQSNLKKIESLEKEANQQLRRKLIFRTDKAQKSDK